ncbi:MAG: sodium-dependent transporter [Erysipelotrichaceae bacterium]|nr:sodium-dependent transporter [Erysipelotrichaceae bacterium]MDD3809734.1 sodium-dependent transporter [Erysipelotrichaceae bacterium]
MEKNKFSSRIGFVMAVAGSAVGLGNIWRFPYLAAKYGGGTFLIVYIALALTIGFTLLVSETAIGRMTGAPSPIKAYRQLKAGKLRFGGYINALVPILILPYYSAIGGWVLKYFYEYLTGNSQALVAPDYFGSFISNPLQPVIFLMAFTGICYAIITQGVKDGIEKMSLILMPVLIVLAVFISGYTLTTPGAMEGVKYYLSIKPEYFNISTVVAALGQIFYSLSIGMGILITFGSYMDKKDDLESSIGQIEIMDTLIAFLAGMMIIPAVFAFSNGANVAAGPSLMFITLPQVFASMAFGNIVGLVFFLLVFFAALTSAVSLYEANVAIVEEVFQIGRKKANHMLFVWTFGIGMLVALGFNVLSFVQVAGMSILDMLDFVTNSIFMPIGALCTVLLIVFVVKTDKIVAEVKVSSKFIREKVYRFLVKYIAAPALIVILVSFILASLKIISI